MTDFSKLVTSKLGLEKGPFLLGRKGYMTLPENRDIPVPTPMKSLVAEGAIILEKTIPAETQINQDELDRAAVERGKLIEMFG